MKKIISLLSAVMMLAVSISGVAFANGDRTTPQWQAPVHNQSLDFQATYQNGVVSMTWNTFIPNSSNWKYRKVVRSTNKTNPVYPDDGYIKYAGDTNFTSYIDTNPPEGIVYYGICAITENTYGKYRNCDWQTVTVNGTVTPTPTPTPTPVVVSGLSNSLKAAVDALIVKLMGNLEDKLGDDVDAKITLLQTLVTKLGNTTVSYRVKPLITYLVAQLDERLGLLQVEALLNID